MEPLAPTGGRRGKELRTAVRVGRERRPTPYDREGDPELRALVEEPYTSVEETHRRLQELRAALEAREDRRAAFLAIYSPMTRAVAQGVQRGEFTDPDWVGDYLVVFANLYREAVLDYERGALDSLPDPWQLAFESAQRGESLVVQDAALGVNAHINYDLALALERVGVRSDPETKYEDHAAVTEVIRDLVDGAQRSLGARDADGIDRLDDALGEFDERFLIFTIHECRDSAWRTAQALTSRFPLRRRIGRWFNDVTSTGAAYLILGSHASDRVHETLVELERSPE